MMPRVIFFCLPIILSTVANAQTLSQEDVQTLLAKYCVQCHGPDEQNAGIRLEDFVWDTEQTQGLRTLVHEAVIRREMPPEGEPQPSDEERQQIVNWIVARAGAKAMATSVTQRRLNRRELSAALQDLTGLPIDFGAGLPEDGKVDGFDTGALGLQDAADSVAQWLEVTRRAADSIRFLDPPSESTIRIDFRQHDFTDWRKFLAQRWNEHEDHVFTRAKRLTCKKNVGLFLPTKWADDRSNSFIAVPAPKDKRAALTMKMRVRSIRPMNGLPEPMLWVNVGGKYIDYRPIGESTETLTYAVRMEDHVIEGRVIKIILQSIVEMPYAVDGFENDDRSKPGDNIPGGIGTFRPKFDRKVLRTPEAQPVPSIIIESIEIDYDHHAEWPPAEWKARVCKKEATNEYAQQLLTLWMNRAWRRPIESAEVTKFMTLYKKLRGEGFSFDDALRSAFQAVLMGGPFRFLASPADPNQVIAQHAIASRLSFMLVGMPPDTELRQLAVAGQLRDPRVLGAQVDRLLADPRSDAFFNPFVRQWLSMDQPITLVMSHFKKQDFKFGRNLKASMSNETVQYVARLFADNRPAKELVSSDWTMMNDILAVHYGYEGITGANLRKVKLEIRPEDPRGGGVFSHAGIQSMLCWMGDNWLIYRGSWTLNHILDDPPPNPPLEVPELSPFDDQNHGKSFRELLAQHQADSKCAICHKKMDPLGFAFQNFDLSGRWRNLEHERYHRYELDGKIEWRGEGESRPVDASGVLPRGEEFRNYQEFKTLLAKHYLDDIVRGVLKRLTLYATGRQANVLDMIAIRDIMNEHADEGYLMRELLKGFIRSRVFLETYTTDQQGARP